MYLGNCACILTQKTSENEQKKKHKKTKSQAEKQELRSSRATLLNDEYPSETFSSVFYTAPLL